VSWTRATPCSWATASTTPQPRRRLVRGHPRRGPSGHPARADFYFLGEGIAAVRRALLAARHLRRVVRANLVLAVLYNAVALTLCFLGLVSPVVAALLMPASSIAVVSLTVFRLTGRRLAWTS